MIGFAQIMYFRIPSHAAVDTTVSLFKGKIIKWRPLANAVLRKLSTNYKYKDKNENNYILNTPKWLINSWSDHYGEDASRMIAKNNFNEPSLYISVKDNIEFWEKELDGKIIYDTAIKIPKKGKIENIKGFQEGNWWVQDFSSQLPVKFLGDIKNKKILDLCASPGGKTAQLVKEGANVTSVEISQKRGEVLKRNLSRLGYLSSVNVIIADVINWVPKEKFDGILLDAPCSSTGTIRRNPDILLNKKFEDVKKMALLQKNLLKAATEMVSSGSLIIYSNCSLQKEEGEQVVKYVKNKNLFKEHPISSAELKNYPEVILNKGCIRTFPYMLNTYGGIDGFFIARFIKQ